MKQIIAIIRPERVDTTLASLARLRIFPVLSIAVLGRGRQKGFVEGPSLIGLFGQRIQNPFRRTLRQKNNSKKSPAATPSETMTRFLPKQMLMLMVPDAETDRVLDVLLSENQSGRHGDGTIFVCPAGQLAGPDL